MADIKIYGKLVANTEEQVVADASSIQDTARNQKLSVTLNELAQGTGLKVLEVNLNNYLSQDGLLALIQGINYATVDDIISYQFSSNIAVDSSYNAVHVTASVSGQGGIDLYLLKSINDQFSCMSIKNQGYNSKYTIVQNASLIAYGGYIRGIIVANELVGNLCDLVNGRSELTSTKLTYWFPVGVLPTHIKLANDIIIDLQGNEYCAIGNETVDAEISNRVYLNVVKIDINGDFSSVSANDVKVVDFLWQHIENPSSFSFDDLPRFSGGSEIVNKTYAELVSMVNGGTLEKGTYYRITDYVTTCNGVYDLSSFGQQGAYLPYATSAEHPFDLIVLAIENNKLDEHAIAVQHSGDTYFANSNLLAWDIKYTIENDNTKYSWADTVNGKGVITFMRDEFGNEACFDFKNIMNLQFALVPSENATRKVVSYHYSLSGNCISRMGSLYDVFLTLKGAITVPYESKFDTQSFNGVDAINLVVFITDVRKSTLDSPMNWTYMLMGLSQMTGSTIDLATLASLLGTTEQVLSSMTERQVIRQLFNADFYYTFDFVDNQSIDTHLDYSLQGGKCNGNKISHTSDAFTTLLAQMNEGQGTVIPHGLNVCTFENTTYGVDNFDGRCVDNVIGSNSLLCVFGKECSRNKIKDFCINIKITNNCYDNSISNYCTKCIFGHNSTANNIEQECSSIYLLYGANYNTVLQHCEEITFGIADSNSNFINSKCNSIIIDGSHNSFGNDCQNITFSSYCNHISLGDGCEGISLVNRGYKYIEFGNGVSNVSLTASYSNYMEYVSNVKICSGVKGSANTTPLTITLDRTDVYREYKASNSQEILLGGE